MSTDDFYRDLPAFSDFSDIANPASYRAVPDDWIVLATDIQGSTKAISDGRYKDVNMLGAASITAVLNTVDTAQIPFVFGGDGGTVVVPAAHAEPATLALLGLQATSQQTFGLALRVGAVPVADIRSSGSDILVGKYQLSPGNFLAMFAGGGMELADHFLKDHIDDARYLPIAPPDLAPPDLEGLSCRWEPLEPRGGRMLAIMVRDIAQDPAAQAARIRTVIEALSDRLGNDLEQAAPANTHSMRFRWPPRGLALEARATAGGKSLLRNFCKVLFGSFVQAICERFDRSAGGYDAPAYRAELRANTDFRKFDGILRLVLDVTEEQAKAIEDYLESEYRAGHLVYGTHAADTAFMTCLIFSLEQSEHVHFVDASAGGYAMAAVGFKRRAKEAQRLNAG